MARGKHKATLPRSLEIFVQEQFSNGINHKKRKVQKQNNGYSPYVHSFSTLNRYSSIVKGFIKYIRQTFNINRVDRINEEHLKSYINYKINKKVSEKTMKINLSALKKYFLCFDRHDLAKHIDYNYQEYYNKCVSYKQCEPIPQTQIDKVINAIDKKNKLFGAMARVQLHTGARLGDIKKFGYDKKQYKLVIYNSKGGKTRELDYSDRKDIFDKVISDIKLIKEALIDPTRFGYKNAKSIRKQYARCISNTTKELLEEKFTTHSLRYDYAVNRSLELKDVSNKNKIITKELGHNRESMAEYYYKNFI